MQPTTMAMLMVLDRPPEPDRLRAAFARTIAAVPRLAQRIVDAPLDLTLPRWTHDPTFDLDYHLRRRAVPDGADLHALFRAIGPVYETPIDRSRPLWEAKVYDGLQPGDRSAMFFKLHHAIADGVGGNAIFAALTDWERTSPTADDVPVELPAGGSWPEPAPLGNRLVDAIRDRVALDIGRAGTLARTLVDAVQHPEKLATAMQVVGSVIETGTFDSHSPLKERVGRTRRLDGLELSLDEARGMKQALGGTMIDVILTVMARAIGRWHARHHLNDVEELLTLVPVNLRKPEEWAEKPNVGNVASGILVPLPIRIRSALATHAEIHRRMELKRADPTSSASPILSEVISALPRPLVSWMAQNTFGNIDFIVTNVPGIRVPRYLAGAEIVAAYPFAPIAAKSPVSIALYGYCDRLFVGIDSDAATMPDAEVFKAMIGEAFAELRAAAGGKRRRRRNTVNGKRQP